MFDAIATEVASSPLGAGSAIISLTAFAFGLIRFTARGGGRNATRGKSNDDYERPSFRDSKMPMPRRPIVAFMALPLVWYAAFLVLKLGTPLALHWVMMWSAVITHWALSLMDLIVYHEFERRMFVWGDVAIKTVGREDAYAEIEDVYNPTPANTTLPIGAAISAFWGLMLVLEAVRAPLDWSVLWENGLSFLMSLGGFLFSTVFLVILIRLLDRRLRPAKPPSRYW